MGKEKLKWAILQMADADDSLCEEAILLILGALESDEMFAEVIRGDAGSIERAAPNPQSNPLVLI